MSYLLVLRATYTLYESFRQVSDRSTEQPSPRAAGFIHLNTPVGSLFFAFVVTNTCAVVLWLPVLLSARENRNMFIMMWVKVHPTSSSPSEAPE